MKMTLEETWIQEELRMDMKQKFSTTSSQSAPIADCQPKLENTRLILYSNDLLEYVSWLKQKVDLLFKTEPKCSLCDNAIQTKILDFFSSMIIELEKEAIRDIQIGAEKTELSVQ
jgi:hypothetical protein